MNGIDISQWQGDMDLTPYKDGFVIIRGGFWTSADPWAERNIAKCEKLGIPWGLYWYSYALIEAQARQQLRLIKPGEVLYMFPSEITDRDDSSTGGQKGDSSQ